MLKRVLHTGIAAPDLKVAIARYEALGFQVASQFHKSDLDADIVMMVNGEATYEIFEFHNPDHPQVQYIRNHVAFYSDDLEADIALLQQEGLTITIPITDGMLYRFAYLQDKLGMNYEIATDKN